jgi:Asp-tRNA(Asn)/Glu-tRNA(Gln) amidotransferase A subunit family amidase
MRFDEYRKLDGVALSALIAKGEVTAREVLDTAIARADEVNPAINAVVCKQYDRARATVAAGLPHGPLTGVPFLIKDLSIYEKGVPASLGSRLYAGFVPDHDSAYTARCKRAGLVIMGRSLSPEFGLSPSTEPQRFGACRNPWNLEYSAGGSSGGAAAAVSAGIVPVAHGTDGGGSIRTPAAQCGLFGLKPSRGRISFAPDSGEGWGGLAVGHVVSRSVRDSALMLDCTSGVEPGDPYAAPTPERPFAEAVEQAPARLRIAMMRKDHRGVALHPECIKAVENAAKLCEGLGHIVEEAAPDIDLNVLRPQSQVLLCTNVARTLGLRWKALKRQPNPSDVEALTWAVYNRGLKITGSEYVEALAATHAAGRKLAAFLAGYDIILTSTVAAPPPKLGYFDTNGDVAIFRTRVTEYLSITPLYNATGTPAMSVPLHWTSDGLPVGVHFGARYGAETTLLQLAAQLEQAQPWFDRLPSL